MRFNTLLAAVLLAFSATMTLAESRLLYFEAQAVGGYSSHQDKVVYDSMSHRDVMQKPSIGADYIQKFSNKTGDWGTLALQGRLTWDNEGHPSVEPQLYNAYL